MTAGAGAGVALGRGGVPEMRRFEGAAASPPGVSGVGVCGQVTVVLLSVTAYGAVSEIRRTS